jgi:hypothetical protein
MTTSARNVTANPIKRMGRNMARSYERIKNFSTSIEVERTIAEIERMLAKYGATKIMKEYDDKGQVNKLAFAIPSVRGEMPIKLPMNKAGLLNVFKYQVHDGKLPKKFWGGDFSEQQAGRTGWRIIKDWLEAQLALLNIEMVKIEEIFLPYIYNAKIGKTMFEVLEQKGFNIEQIEYREKEVKND